MKRNAYKKPSLEAFKAVANACCGIMAEMADRLGVSRNSLYCWCKNDPEYRVAVEEAREQLLDLAETNLRRLIAGVPKMTKDENGEEQFAGWDVRPSEQAIIFLLKTRGKKRGYVEKTEIDGQVNLQGSIPIRAWIEEQLKAKK